MNIINNLTELTKNDSAGTTEFLRNVISNQEDIRPLLVYHEVDRFHKVYDEVMLYNGRQLVFSGTIEDGKIVNLWSKNGLVWSKPDND